MLTVTIYFPPISVPASHFYIPIPIFLHTT